MHVSHKKYKQFQLVISTERNFLKQELIKSHIKSTDTNLQ